MNSLIQVVSSYWPKARRGYAMAWCPLSMCVRKQLLVNAKQSLVLIVQPDPHMQDWIMALEIVKIAIRACEHNRGSIYYLIYYYY